jgi:choline dehydrogenase-like flavoprotein
MGRQTQSTVEWEDRFLSSQRLTKREVMPGNLKRAALENFIRDSVVTYWHQTCTAKTGRDLMSVVDAKLKVYGIENVRIADGSIIAARNNRQHHGSLRHYRRACRRNTESRS